MITAIAGPLVVEPSVWVVVFNRTAATWWAGWLAFGQYKHVRAYAYVPFLHVWVFVDPNLMGIDVLIAADGAPARAMISAWIDNADLVKVRAQRDGRRRFPLFGWCVPVIARLTGVPSGALRADAFFRDCLRYGGEPFEASCGRTEISTASA